MITKVILTPQAEAIIRREIINCPKRETGGVLCGRYQGDTIIVESVSGPGPNAKKSLVEFTMDKTHMHEFLDKEYIDSQGKNIYVGEWHTHPQVHPTPSTQDGVSIFERSIEWQYGDLAFLIFGFYKFSSTGMRKNNICLHYDSETDQIWEIPLEFS